MAIWGRLSFVVCALLLGFVLLRTSNTSTYELTANQQRLLEAIEISQEPGKFGIFVRGFTIEDGIERIDVCQKYGRIVATLLAEGVAVNGVRPQLKVSRACSREQEGPPLAGLWMPLSELAQRQPASDTNELTLGGVRYEFTETGSQWPKTWALMRVDLEDANKNKLSIDFAKRKRIPVLTWP